MIQKESFFERFSRRHFALSSVFTEGMTMKLTVSNTRNTQLLNERDKSPAGVVNLAYIATIIQRYRDECGQADPYVHSSFVARVADLLHFSEDIRRTALDENDLLCLNIATALILAALERNTNLENHELTPSDVVVKIFDDDFLNVLRDQLCAVPFYVFEDNPSIGVIDLWGIPRFAMKMCPNLWMTPEEVDQTHEDRIMGRSVEFQFIDEAEVVGEEDAISAFDEWADEQDFPWNAKNSDF